MRPINIQLPANESQTIARVGHTVYLSESTGVVRVTGYSAGGLIVLQADLANGNKITSNSDFTSLEFEDRSGAANAITAIAGLGDFNESGLGTINGITNAVQIDHGDTLTGSGDVTIIAGATDSIAANVNRRGLMIQAAQGNTNPLQVRDGAGNVATLLQPAAVLTLETTAALQVHNASAGSLVYRTMTTGRV